ncbi:hypothetical protein O3P69_004446 [Scylla paramamosain]|uniref:C-type lectin domain-containing protein n=1 Tax=Scylla paramamosain TaxID=85552 RepID=A0AAW0UCZ4_SCYPA
MAPSRPLVLLTVLLSLTLIAAKRMTCPGNWMKFENLCVWPSNSSMTNWEAIEECKKRGADLLFINNSEENYFLAGILFVMRMDTVWLGLNDLRLDHVYEWEGKEKLTYTNFFKGEPYDRKRHPEDCVAMSKELGYKWSSEYCFNYKLFVCRKRLS